ncbi:MAG TPA: glycosyltransferase, partial [Chthoniobacterales bacterium]
MEIKPFLTWIVIPVHNRKALTLACLGHLRKTGVLDWAKVVVVDDGSTDGTAPAIAGAFPEVVLLPGGGNLWWGGGIEKGMRFAHAAGAEAVIWLNDDTLPRPGVLREMVELSLSRQANVTAATIQSETFSFGGQTQTRSGITPIDRCPPEPIECDTFHGNLVCFPRQTIDRIGFIRGDLFPHTGGDSDYGLLARRQGIPNLYARNLVADLLEHERPQMDSFLAGDTPLAVLWARVFRVGHGLYWRSNWWLRVRHWGAWGVWLFLKMYVRLLLLSLARVCLPKEFRSRLALRF